MEIRPARGSVIPVAIRATTRPENFVFLIQRVRKGAKMAQSWSVPASAQLLSAIARLGSVHQRCL
jgi:hypothetical protein